MVQLDQRAKRGTGAVEPSGVGAQVYEEIRETGMDTATETDAGVGSKNSSDSYQITFCEAYGKTLS